MARVLLCALLGGLAGGVIWAAVEVAWTTFQPHVTIDALRVPSLVPPRELGRFIAVATATYGAIGVVLGAGAGLVLRVRGVRVEDRSAFLVGACAAAGVLGAFGGSVWANLLSNTPLGLHSLLNTGAAALAVAVAVVALGLALRALLPGLAATVVVVGLALPGALLALGAWAHAGIEFPPEPVRGAPPADRPNVLFVTIDTLRADYVGVYGADVETPVLDRLAREGTWFRWAFSQVPHTTPSHVSIFTSLYPFAHGARNGVPFKPGLSTLPALLLGEGYRTAAFVSAYTTKSHATGLGGAFDVYVDSLNPWVAFASDDAAEPLSLYRVIDRTAGNQIAAPVVNERVLSWTDGGVREPWFLWVHYFDPHGPFDPVPAYRERYVRPGQSDAERELALYAAEVSYTDAQLGRLLDALEGRGLLEDTIVVVTSDHGEAFLEPHPRPEHGHGQTLYDPALRVPLLFWGPGRIAAGRVVERITESVDIGPTLLDLLDLPTPDSFVGRSLAAVVEGTTDGVTGPELAFSQTAEHRRSHWFAIRSPAWKLHVNSGSGEEELFDLVTDPNELVNVVEERPEVAQEYRELLGRTMDLDAGTTDEPDLDRETYERLKAMGYIAE